MNEKEVAELRRQFRPDHHTITKVYGCYVNENKTVISTFEQSMALASQEEAESYLALLKKSLSGTLGRNLLDIAFTNQQVMNGAEHALLMKLRETRLEDAETREAFYQKIIDAVYLECNYLILMAFNAYDVPYRTKDDIDMEDCSEEMFSYLICSICTVKKTKPGLGYDYHQQEFHNFAGDHLVSAPEIGFLFPAFDDRQTNLYNALCYTRKVDESHEDFIDAVFRTSVPMSAGHQREAFHEALSQALEKECSYDVVQSVHEQLRERLELHKESRDPEPLTISQGEMGDILKNSGLPEERIDDFQSRCRESFGEDAELRPANLIDSRRFAIATPEVKISVDPKFSYLVQTRVIDGRKYILIAADSGVEVNGVGINITED